MSSIIFNKPIYYRLNISHFLIKLEINTIDLSKKYKISINNFEIIDFYIDGIHNIELVSTKKSTSTKKYKDFLVDEYVDSNYLYISQNGISDLYIIVNSLLKIPSFTIEIININKIKIFEDILVNNIIIHPNTKLLTNIIKIVNLYNKMSNINNYELEYFIEKNKKIISHIKFDFMNYYNSLDIDDKFKNIINNRILFIISEIINNSDQKLKKQKCF